MLFAQYTAAALVSENKVLAHPAAVDSIPTSANQEDHVSMGTIAANQALQILGHVEQVLGIELICATQALDLRSPHTASPAAEAVRARVRQVIPTLAQDRFMGADLAAAKQLIASGELYALLQTLKP